MFSEVADWCSPEKLPRHPSRHFLLLSFVKQYNWTKKNRVFWSNSSAWIWPQTLSDQVKKKVTYDFRSSSETRNLILRLIRAVWGCHRAKGSVSGVSMATTGPGFLIAIVFRKPVNRIDLSVYFFLTMSKARYQKVRGVAIHIPPCIQ